MTTPPQSGSTVASRRLASASSTPRMASASSSMTAIVPVRNGRIDDVRVDTIDATIGLVMAWFVLAWRAHLGVGDRERGERDPSHG